METAKMRHLLYITITCLSFAPCVFSATKTDYYQLYDYLFENSFYYKKEIRPAINEFDFTTVNVMFDLRSIVDVDEKEQTLTISAILSLLWDDNLLSWNKTHYGNITEILVPQKNVYLPDLIVANSVREARELGIIPYSALLMEPVKERHNGLITCLSIFPNSHFFQLAFEDLRGKRAHVNFKISYPELQVRLLANGTISWKVSLLLVTQCDIDITFFPFDTQTCYIIFETAVSRNDEILLTLNSDSLPLFVFSPNGQWDLIEISNEDANPLSNRASIQFGLLLKRRRTFYILTILLPIFFLSLTASLVFALPADEGEKMGTGITVLLAFAVYLTIVSDLVPNTSLQVSILSVYLTTLLGMSAVSVIVCVFILRLHFREDDMPVGPKTTSFIIFLRRMMCLQKHKEIASNKVKPQNGTTTNNILDDKTIPRTNGTKDHTVAVQQVFLDDTKDALTWKEVAKTLDHFCFVLFTFLTIAFTLIILLTISVGAEIYAPAFSRMRSE